jgi:hypothetical protein
MKKKISSLIFIAIYLVSLMAGFTLAGIHKAQAATPVVNGNRQANWIFVRVDDMTTDRPQLVSIWAMFMSVAPGPQVFFKPIYSADTTSASAQKLARSFSVNVDRTISNDFIQELDRLNIQRTGMVIIDNTGFQAFSSWFNSNAAASQPNVFVPNTGKPIAAKPGPEVQSFQQICATIQSPGGPRSQSLAWHSLVPYHILPHPNIDKLVELWDKILSSSAPGHCEVIAY